MSEKIDKKAILEDIKKKLEEPIPNFWKASITLGRTTELEYYSKIIVGQTFCGRQKDRLKRQIVKDLNSVINAIDHKRRIILNIKGKEFYEILKKWEVKKK